MFTSGIALTLAAVKLCFAASVTDFRGKTVEFAAPPKRVVAMMPALGEVVAALGEGKALVGVPEYTDLSAELKKRVKTLGPYTQMSAEVIYSLKPDLVIASMDGNEASLVSQLERLKLKVMTVNTTSLDEIVRSLSMVSEVFGHGPKPKLVKELEDELKNVTRSDSAAKPLKVFLQVGWKPLITSGPKTFLGEIIERVGAENIFASAAFKYPRPNPEDVVAANPDVIIICPLTEDMTEVKESKAYWGQFKNMTAVKNGRIHAMKVNALTKPGFGLTTGVRELKKILYNQ